MSDGRPEPEDVRHSERARRLISNTALLAGAQGLVRAASLVAFPLLTNSVEAKTFGLYTYALQITAAWAVLANFQLKVPLLRDLNREPEESGAIVAQALTLRLLLAAAIAVPNAVWCLTHFASAREQGIFLWLLLANLLMAITATFEEALQAREAFVLYAVATVVNGAVVNGGQIFGVLVGRPIAWTVGAQVAAAALSFALTARFARRVLGQPVLRWVWRGERVGAMVRLAAGVAVAAQVGAWYGRVDLLAVGRLLGATALGQYAVPYRALEVAMAGTMTVHFALVPMLARAQAAGAEQFVPRLSTVLRFGLLLLAPAAAVVSGLAPQLLLLFKPEYAPAAGPLRLLIWVMPLMFTDAVLHWVLYLDERPWQPLATLVLALVVNSLLCCVLVPRYGLVGAATARVAAEAGIVAAAAVLVHRRVALPWGRVLLRPAAMVAALGAAWTVTPGPWWAAATMGLLAYVVAGWLLRPLEPREWAILRDLLARRKSRQDGRE